MSPRMTWLPLAAGIALVAIPAGARGETRKVTLAEVTALAVANHPDLAGAALGAKAATSDRRAALARMGPALKVEGSVLVWDSPVELALGGGEGGLGFDPSLLPPPSTPYEMAFLGFAGGLAEAFGTPTTVRGRVTGSFSVTLIQPLTPLLAMYEGYKAADLMVTVARLQIEQRRREVVLGATRAYYDALRAAGLAELAADAVEQLEAHVARARSFHTAGLIDRSSLLAAEVALAGAQGGLVSARAGVAVARAALAVAAGLMPSEVLVPLEDAGAGTVVAIEFAVEEAERRALASRPELDVLAAQVAAAEAGARAATAALLPTVALIANYTHSEGSTFSSPDSFYGGASLSWDAWDWGAKYHARAAAKSRAEMAASAITKVRALLALEVRAAYVRVQAAAEMLRVTEAAVTAATESFRIETTRFAANANTSTDVLDAEGRVSKARSDATMARFDWLVAVAVLRVAMGELPGAPVPAGEVR